MRTNFALFFSSTPASQACHAMLQPLSCLDALAHGTHHERSWWPVGSNFNSWLARRQSTNNDESPSHWAGPTANPGPWSRGSRRVVGLRYRGKSVWPLIKERLIGLFGIVCLIGLPLSVGIPATVQSCLVFARKSSSLGIQTKRPPCKELSNHIPTLLRLGSSLRE